ncbi:hypothetical protein ES703_57299 [subsurface metagenome]
MRYCGREFKEVEIDLSSFHLLFGILEIGKYISDVLLPVNQKLLLISV